MGITGSGWQLEGVIVGCLRDGEQVLNKIGSVAHIPITQSLVPFLHQHYHGGLAASGRPLGFPSQGRIHRGPELVIGVLQLPRSRYLLLS